MQIGDRKRGLRQILSTLELQVNMMNVLNDAVHQDFFVWSIAEISSPEVIQE